MSEDRPKRVAIIAAHGTLDAAYPPLIIASTAAALDMEVAIFFTFYGLDIINKKKLNNLKVPSVGNPAMPVPVPNVVGMLPGMTSMATGMMKGKMKKANVATIPELLEICEEAEVRLIACQMTLDVLGIKNEDIMDGVEFAGASTFLEFAKDADITLTF